MFFKFKFIFIFISRFKNTYFLNIFKFIYKYKIHFFTQTIQITNFSINLENTYFLSILKFISIFTFHLYKESIQKNIRERKKDPSPAYSKIPFCSICPLAGRFSLSPTHGSS